MTSVLVGRRRRFTVGIGVAVALSAGSLTAGLFLGPAVRSPAQAAADAAPPVASLVTAEVERRALVEPVIVRGTVVSGDSVSLTVPAGLSGPDAVVTGVRVRPGAILREGQVFLEVAGAPVFGLMLPFPLYRDLRAGARGPDVVEVQRALRRLGHDAPADGIFDRRTQAALDRFYRSRAFPAPTGPGGPMLPRNQVVRFDRAARTVSNTPVRVGNVLADRETVVLELDAVAQTIQGSVSAEQRPLIAVGSLADVADEVRGVTTKAKVRRIADDVSQGSDGTGYQLTLDFTAKALPPSKAHTVLVTVKTAVDAAPVLAVPVTAVHSRPDGTTLVTVHHGDGSTNDVPVRTGKTAGGWVAAVPVSGTLEPGTKVVVGVADGTGG